MKKNNDYIRVRGARQHNLKNIDVDIPKNKLVVFTGMSGSGKSSLAFDTIYADGQRRYVESLSTYARQFLGIMDKPDVDKIEGLSPAISIDQKTVSHNPRSTVGTVTEIYDYMRLLYSRVGHPHCPICGREIATQSVEQITEAIASKIKEDVGARGAARYLVLSPVVKDKKGAFDSLFDNLRSKGYKRVRIDGQVKDMREEFVLLKNNKHTIDAVIDRLGVSSKDLKDKIFVKNLMSRLNDSIEQALKLSEGLVVLTEILEPGFEMIENPKEYEDHLYSERFACPIDNISLPEIEPRTFSFNSPHGACATCSGIGKIMTVNPERVFAAALSIKEGGIVPYATIFEHDTWLARLILEVCRSNDIDANASIGSLSEEQMEILLRGTGGKKYKVKGKNREGKSTMIVETWGGIVADLGRRYTDSSSEYMKSGIEKYMHEVVCQECEGDRLHKEALGITIEGKNIAEASKLSIDRLIEWVRKLNGKRALNNREREIGQLILKEIETRLEFLMDVGLEYLTLSRGASTLAGGEAQRIRLASQIGSGLTGVLYILDEPTIGLHQRDNRRLIDTLKKMRDLGNTVIVVEHDQEVMEAADYIYDFGPQAGKHGGVVVAHGTPVELIKNKNSLTGQYLSGKRKIRFERLNGEIASKLKLIGAASNNLKNIDVEFPLGRLIAVTGVSGSGKSSLVVDTFYKALVEGINKYYSDAGGKYKKIEGVENIDKVLLIDQSPIGRTPRSNPATYTKVFDLIRDVFAMTHEAKALGFKKGRFSFNVRGGRCEACEGQGQTKIEMQFMPDIWVACEVCQGARYNSQTLEVVYRGKNIAEVLKMTVGEAIEFFHAFPNIASKLETMHAVGLDYMELGQSATTLSGGEAQRVKLSTELSKRATGSTLYVLDEPTTGLHFADLEKLLGVLRILVERGNTVVVIEHNSDVIKNSDWIIDMGPEGGDRGGEIVAEGTVETVRKNVNSYTGAFLRELR